MSGTAWVGTSGVARHFIRGDDGGSGKEKGN